MEIDWKEQLKEQLRMFGEQMTTQMAQPHLEVEEGEQLEREKNKLMSEPKLQGKDLEMKKELERRLTPALLAMNSDQMTELMKFMLHANNEYEAINLALGGKKDEDLSFEEFSQRERRAMKKALEVMDHHVHEDFDPRFHEDPNPKLKLMEKLNQYHPSVAEKESLKNLDDTLSLMNKSLIPYQVITENGKSLLQRFFEDAKFDVIKSMMKRKLFDIDMICEGEEKSLIDSYAKSFLKDEENNQKYQDEVNEIIELYNSLL